MWCGIYGIDGILLWGDHGWDMAISSWGYYHGILWDYSANLLLRYSGWDMPTIVWYDVHRCLGHKMVLQFYGWSNHFLCPTFAVGPSDWVKICQDWGWAHIFAFRFPLPSGKRLHNYGKSPFSMGKLTIPMAIFNSYVKLPEGNWCFLSRIPPSFGRQTSVRFGWHQPGGACCGEGKSSGTGADADRRGLGDGWKK